MACLWGIAPGSRKTRRRGRNSRLDNGWFLIAFTLVFGHACALLVTALVSKAQARAAARHEKKRSRVRRRAATLVASEEAASPRTRPRGSVVDGLDDVADSEEARTELASALARTKPRATPLRISFIRFYMGVLCRVFYHSCGPCSAASLSLSFASQVGRYLIRNAPSFAPVDDVARQQQVRERLDQDPEPRLHGARQRLCYYY